LLRRREGEIAEGRIPGVLFERVTFDELADDFLINYRRAGRKSIRRAEQLVKHLRGHFQGGKASQIDTPKVQRYIEARLAEGAANGTLNRELAVLKRMLNLGVR
jgi:hypothetical protein